MTAIIFDLDNTLTDRNATIRRYAEVFVEDFRGRLAEAWLPDGVFRILRDADANGYQGPRKRE